MISQKRSIPFGFEFETFLQFKDLFPDLMLWESDYLTLSEITFEWGDSYDCKDWMRLGAILAPTLMVSFGNLLRLSGLYKSV